MKEELLEEGRAQAMVTAARDETRRDRMTEHVARMHNAGGHTETKQGTHAHRVLIGNIRSGVTLHTKTGKRSDTPCAAGTHCGTKRTLAQGHTIGHTGATAHLGILGPTKNRGERREDASRHSSGGGEETKVGFAYWYVHPDFGVHDTPLLSRSRPGDKGRRDVGKVGKVGMWLEALSVIGDQSILKQRRATVRAGTGVTSGNEHVNDMSMQVTSESRVVAGAAYFSREVAASQPSGSSGISAER